MTNWYARGVYLAVYKNIKRWYDIYVNWRILPMQCIKCSEDIEDRRAQLGIKLCLACGDAAAKAARKKWTVAPMHKSNYMLITNRNDLIGLNNKGGSNRT